MPRSAFMILAGLPVSFAATLTATWAWLTNPVGESAWAIVALSGVIAFGVLVLLAGRTMANIGSARTRERNRNRELDALIEASNDAEKRFWSGLSHDLRTPLNSIIGYTELMLDELPEDNPGAFRHDLERIKSAGFDLLVRINELLAVSELKTGISDPHFETTDVRGLVADVGAVLESLAARQNTRLQFELPPAPCVLKTDGVRLERLLLALVTNAIKSTIDGHIEIAAGYDDARGCLNLDVRDSGQGMEADSLDTIFEPYSQAREMSSNSGLGMSVCKHLVEELGGSISVQSRPGHGTVFSVSIPAARETERTTEMLRETAPAGAAPPNVLIIDENEDAADLLSRHLRRFGCHVTMSVDGAFGKDLAVDLQPDLVILEVDMSSIDGWAVLQHLKYDSRTRDIPVVICSSLDMRRRAHELGAADYLLKPVTVTSAIAGLTQLARRHSRPLGAMEQQA